MGTTLKIANVENLNYEFHRLLEQSPLPDASYYQFSLFANDEGKFHYSFFTHWGGWADDNHKYELRKPSLVEPQKSIELFLSIKEPLLIINCADDLSIHLYFLGGNSLIEKSLGDKYLAHVLKPTKNVHTYDKGFIDVESVPKPMFNRAPNPKLRMSVIKRDNMKCKICGASPQNNEHVELHLHHIVPFSNGGLTDKNNLITLCHTCHKGLEPHLDYSLFNLIDIEILSSRMSTEDYGTKIRRNVETSIKRLKLKQAKEKGKLQI